VVTNTTQTCSLSLHEEACSLILIRHYESMDLERSGIYVTQCTSTRMILPSHVSDKFVRSV